MNIEGNNNYQSLFENWMGAYKSHYEELHRQHSDMRDEFTQKMRGYMDKHISSLEDRLETIKKENTTQIPSLMMESLVDGAKRM